MNFIDNEYKIQYIIIVILIILLAITSYNINIENFTTTSTTNEAIQNIAQVYNNQNMTLSNLTATGKITTNSITANDQYYSTGGVAGYNFSDRSKPDRWSLYADNGYTRLWTEKGGGDKLSIDQSGNIYLNGSLNAIGDIKTNGNLIVNGGIWQPQLIMIIACYDINPSNNINSWSGCLGIDTNNIITLVPKNISNMIFYWLGNRLLYKHLNGTTYAVADKTPQGDSVSIYTLDTISNNNNQIWSRISNNFGSYFYHNTGTNKYMCYWKGFQTLPNFDSNNSAIYWKELVA